MPSSNANPTRLIVAILFVAAFGWFIYHTMPDSEIGHRLSAMTFLENGQLEVLASQTARDLHNVSVRVELTDAHGKALFQNITCDEWLPSVATWKGDRNIHFKFQAGDFDVQKIEIVGKAKEGDIKFVGVLSSEKKRDNGAIRKDWEWH